MNYGYRSSSDSYFYWLFWLAFAACFVGTLLLISYCDDQARLDCERKGGQYVHVYKSSLCVKKGSVIE